MGTRLERSLKNNPELIDLIFKLMFETIRLTPHDLRREKPVFHDFEQSAQQLVGLLCATDLAGAGDELLGQMRQTAAVLSESVEQMYRAGIISRADYLRAKEQVWGITEPLTAVSAAPELG